MRVGHADACRVGGWVFHYCPASVRAYAQRLTDSMEECCACAYVVVDPACRVKEMGSLWPSHWKPFRGGWLVDWQCLCMQETIGPGSTAMVDILRHRCTVSRPS